MRAPDFWQAGRGALAAPLLWPAAALWAWATRRRLRRGRPFDPGVPVLCAGNVTAGGTGKTPLVLFLARHLAARGHRPAILSRGYGGRAREPLRVDPVRHIAALVGDEPLELAAAAPTYVGRDRVALARLAVAEGADCLLLDDGFQDPALVKHLSLLAVDGGAGLGNGRIIPAGPCREPWTAALARAQAVMVIGPVTAALPSAGDRLLLHGRLAPVDGDRFAGRPVVAFAGIGRPAKFFATLDGLGADLVACRGFADHYAYRPEDLARLTALARTRGAVPVTTRKDWLRLSPAQREGIAVLDVELVPDDPAALARLLAGFP